MADSPILKIPVDTEDFDAFLKKFQEYRVSAESHAQGSGINMNFVAKMKAAANDPKLTGPSSFIRVFRDNSRDISRSWENTVKSLEKGTRYLSNLSRGSVGGVAVGAGITGAITGIISALAGATIFAAGSQAQRNFTNRALGVAPGQYEGFGIAYERFLGGKEPAEETLSKIARAKRDPTQWGPFWAVGLTNDQIANSNPEELTATFLERATSKYRQMGPTNGTLWANSLLGDFISPDQLNASATRTPEEFTAARKRYQEYEQQFKQKQGDLDTATDAKERFDASLQRVITSLQNDFVKLERPLSDVAEGFAKLVDRLSKDGTLDRALTTVTNGLETFARWLAAFQPSGGDTTPANPTDMGPSPANRRHTQLIARQGGGSEAQAAEQNEGFWARAAKFVFGGLLTGIPKAMSTVAGNSGKELPPGAVVVDDPDKAKHFGEWERKYGLPKGLLAADEQIESHGGNHAALVGPMTKYGWRAQGAFQFSPGSSRDYGVKNPFNEAEEGEAAARKFSDLLKHYGGDLEKAAIAFDWGQGSLDKDIKEHPSDWRKYTPEESRNYVEKLRQHGINIDSQSIGQAIGEQVSKAMSSAQVAAARQADNQPRAQVASAKTAQPNNLPVVRPVVEIRNFTGGDMNTTIASLGSAGYGA